jgi:hypothetical protein
MEVQRILPKTIHMRGEVRAQSGQDLFVHGIPFGRELMQDARLRMHIVEDQAIGDEMAILDPFPLDRPVVRGNQALTPKEDPTNEATLLLDSRVFCSRVVREGGLVFKTIEK